MASSSLPVLRQLLNEATPGPWEYARHVDGSASGTGPIVVADGYGFPAECLDLNGDADARLIAAAVTALPALLDLVERQAAAIEAVQELAELWRYKGEFGWGPWQEGYGPDPDGQVLDDVATHIRDALKPHLSGITPTTEETSHA